MSTHEAVLGFRYLQSRMTGNVTLTGIVTGGIHRDLAHALDVPPWIVYSHFGGNDDTTFGAVRVASEMLYLVKVVGPVKITQTLEDAAALIDDVIKTAVEVSVTGGVIKDCHRWQPFYLPENVNGERWCNIGGIYRLVAQSS